MDNKNFDTRLKASLEHLDAPFEASTWAAMEQRLNTRTAGPDQPAPVDKAVLRALDNLEAPYVPAHWEMLAQRMTDDARRRRRIWMTKLGEAAIFLLFFANLHSFLGRTPDDKTPGTHKPAANIPIAAAPTRSHSGQHATAGHNKNDNTDNTVSDATAAGSNTGLGVSNPAAMLEFTLLNGLGAPALIQHPTDGTTENTPANTILAAAEINPLFPGTVSAFAPLSAPTVQPLATTFETLSVPFFVNKAPKASHLYVASFASLDNNTVVSGDYSTKSKGFGGGIALGIRKMKWGVEAGLGYSHKQYTPKKELEIYSGNVANGYYGSYAHEIEAELVSIPVKITRRMARFSKISIHAVAGVTTNIALEKAYHYRTVFFPGSTPDAQPGSQQIVQQPQFRKQGKGVLENGKLTGNVYASADVGARVEVPVGQNTTLYVEPTYRQALGGKGIGPKKAAIHSVCLQVGVLAGL